VGGLNLDNISVGDGPFSDSNWQHSYFTTEKGFGRQPKMKKILKGWNLTAESVKSWVEN
jgi:hypothetical protein